MVCIDKKSSKIVQEGKQMGSSVRFFMCCVVFLFFLSGCGDKEIPQYTGVQYPPTTTVIPSFQVDQIPVSCRVFSHLLVWLPAGMNGQQVASSVEEEAKTRGAEMVLLGESRQAKDERGLQFVYYGPAEEYKCRDRWCGWKFGFEEWTNLGDWVNLGYKEWGNKDVVLSAPVVMQAAFLRCSE